MGHNLGFEHDDEIGSCDCDDPVGTCIMESYLKSVVLFCSLAVLDPRVGHTMDVLSPFIPVLCHSD